MTNYAAGGVATPADAALMMELGADGVFVGSGIFKSENPEKFARAIVKATENFKDYKLIGELSKDIGDTDERVGNRYSSSGRTYVRSWLVIKSNS